MARIHAVRFPALLSPSRQQNLDARQPSVNDGGGFTPINGRSATAKTDREKMKISYDQDESRWELILRRMGLNPLAAQTVLKVSGWREGIQQTSDDHSAVSVSGNEEPRSALARFIEMSSEERHCLLQDIIGADSVRRVETVIEKDWQCDWALDPAMLLR